MTVDDVVFKDVWGYWARHSGSVERWLVGMIESCIAREGTRLQGFSVEVYGAATVVATGVSNNAISCKHQQTSMQAYKIESSK
jgi:hypothetical protein